MYQSALQANPQQGTLHSQTSLFMVAFYSRDTSWLTSENVGLVDSKVSLKQWLYVVDIK
jgi:hypothetical protein